MHLSWILVTAAVPLAVTASPWSVLATLIAQRDAEANTATTMTVNAATKYQTVDGFGFSQAFGGATPLRYITPAATQKKVLDLLWSPVNGSGMTILRNGIGNSANNSGYMLSILREAPSSPSAAPTYTWDDDDNGQVWLSQKALTYGSDMTVIADAWSAPGFMKTNDNETDGGYLCGVTGGTCKSGNWTQTYANYLVQYVKYYEQVGVPLKHIGFINEPDLIEPYPSMQSSGQQAADFIKVLYPTIKAANLSTGITCCDASGWYVQTSMMSALSSVEKYISIITAHPYSTPISGALATTHPVWQTEWSDQKGNWTADWYINGGKGEGLTWALNIYTGFTTGNCSAYLYWEGAQYGMYRNTMLVSIGFDGSITLPKRYWSFTTYSRFVRPGAKRIATSVKATNLKSTAFLNTDGSVAVQVINTGTSNYTLTMTLSGVTGKNVTSYLTDSYTNMTVSDAKISTNGKTVTGTIPTRSLVGFLIIP